jgi:hypothetical protein
MSLLATYPRLLQALAHEMTPKFLATRSAASVPNVVPCTSTMPAGDAEERAENRLIFGNFLLRKSVDNLDEDPRVGILVITTDLEGWMLQGDFQGWQRSGAYVDRLNSTDLLRYNAYTGIRNAGIIEVRSVGRHFRISKLRVLADYALARTARVAGHPTSPLDGADPEQVGSSRPLQPAVAMPPVVQEKFSPMTAVRVLAYLDGEGYPVVVPVLSLQPAGERALICAEGLAADLLEPLPTGTPVAANLLTLDIVSFQAKGQWLGSRRFLGAPVGAMAVTAVYAGGPPIPGRQVA